jgi:hypothetical protein
MSAPLIRINARCPATGQTSLHSSGSDQMQHFLQWPVLVFIGMSLAFAITLLGVSIADSRHG